jgi:nucleotide-binding universal stress UspA family protein
MNTHAPHQTIVLGVSGSAASASAARWAAAEASRRNARLHAVHVVEPGHRGAISPDRETRLEIDLARRSVPGRIGEWVFRAGVEVDLAVSVVCGDVAEQLARESHDASLVVVGAPDSLHHSTLAADLALRCLCRVAVVGTFGDVSYVEAPHAHSTKGASHARP